MENAHKMTQGADDRNAVSLVVSEEGSTAAKHFSPNFLRVTAQEVLDALGEMDRPDIVLWVYTAPWELEMEPQGQLTISITQGIVTYELGIVFGAPSEIPNMPYRQHLDIEEFESDPENPHSCGIFVANFDECWSLLCRLLNALNPKTVRFRSGA